MEEEFDDASSWDSTDGSAESEQGEHAPRLPEARSLRDRNEIRRPNRYQGGVDPDTALLAESEEPQTYHEAINGPYATQWKQAMDEEIASLRKNNTWSVVSPEKDKKTIDNRWVFKLKRKPDGEIDRFKARLVAKGYSQKPGIDYHETFRPVVKFDSIRIILSLAASRKMVLQQFDIKMAFLNGKLAEKIFMKQPEGYENGTEDVCRLERSLYGLKEASRCWHERFTNSLKKFNLKPTRSDPCVFTNDQCRNSLILAIYIDDGLIAASDNAAVNALLTELEREFEVTTGKLTLFLGFQIERGVDGSIFLHQAGNARRVLERFNMNNANAVAVPMDKH